MADFENTTPFGAFAIPSADRDGRDLLLVVAAAKFQIGGAGSKELTPSPAQEAPPRTDQYYGIPGESSLKLEGQSAFVRPATDVYVSGHACAPEAQPVEQMDVRVVVGSCTVSLRVSGDRVWERTLRRGMAPSRPQPFTRIPIVWERAFGGVAAASSPERPLFEPRNPIGSGLEEDERSVTGRRVPNVEDPGDLLRAPGDRPSPAGLGPVARAWQPRVAYAGTYDNAWRQRRAPLWPVDFDERFFCAAPRPLQAEPHLRGGERVELDGMHPEGTVKFLLPTLRFAARSRFHDGKETRRQLRLDGVYIDVDALELTLYYRSAVDAPLSLVKHRSTLLRLLEPWEEDIR